MIKKICLGCGKLFEAKHNRFKYCSRECAYKNHLKQMNERNKQRYKEEREYRDRVIAYDKEWKQRKKEEKKCH